MVYSIKNVRSTNATNIFIAIFVIFNVARPLLYAGGALELAGVSDEVFVLTSLLLFMLVFLRGGRQLEITQSGMLPLFFYFLYIITLALSGIINPIALDVSVNRYAFGILIELKWFLFLLTIVLVSRYISLTRIFSVVTLTLIIIGLINSVFTISDMFLGADITGKALRSRLGFTLPNGLYGHHSLSAQVSLAAALSALARVINQRSRNISIIYLYLSLITLMHHSAKESVALLVISAVVFGVLYYKYIPVLIPSSIAFGALLFSLGFAKIPAIERIIFYAGEGGEGTVRRLLTRAGYQVGVDHLPFGTGPSSFASEGARRGELSILYSEYGVYGWGANYTNSSYLVDVYWPKIIAESGFLGFLMMVLFVSTIFLYSVRFYNRNRGLSVFPMFIIISTVIVSIGTPAFTGEFYGILFFAMAGIVIANYSSIRKH